MAACHLCRQYLAHMLSAPSRMYISAVEPHIAKISEVERIVCQGRCGDVRNMVLSALPLSCRVATAYMRHCLDVYWLCQMVKHHIRATTRSRHEEGTDVKTKSWPTFVLGSQGRTSGGTSCDYATHLVRCSTWWKASTDVTIEGLYTWTKPVQPLPFPCVQDVDTRKDKTNSSAISRSSSCP
jgi:hypothetical protein